MAFSSVATQVPSGRVTFTLAPATGLYLAFDAQPSSAVECVTTSSPVQTLEHLGGRT